MRISLRIDTYLPGWLEKVANKLNQSRKERALPAQMCWCKGLAVKPQSSIRDGQQTRSCLSFSY